MAGPLSSEEIEDVVSSVRRLVSNEQSPRRTTRDLSAERLLLTPSLRVVSDLSPIAPLVLDAPAPETAPVVGPAAEAEADVADDASVQLIEADWEDELWTAPETASLGEVALAAEEAEVLVPPVDEHADIVIEDVDGPGESWGQTDWTEDEPAAFIPLRRRAEHLAARLAAGVVLDPEDIDDKSAEPVAAETPAPQMAAAPDVAPELLEDGLGLADHEGEPAQAHDPEQEAARQRMPTEFIDADGTELAVLDESALQEIVRQMIREELQGTLGERITRNVRKLVRAEINRALIARDLD